MKMKKGTMSKICTWSLEVVKDKETDSPLEPLERIHPEDALTLYL